MKARPGAGYSYSGGGYMIVQALIEDATGRSFAENAQRYVLAPLGMVHSRFAQPLGRAAQADAASGHDDGNPFRDRVYVYPELAAAGLWATPADLARLLIDVREALSEPGHIVSPVMAATMLTPVVGDWGLGFSLWGQGPNRRFGHGGVQLGFLSQAWINQASGDGIVVMTNGEGGMTLTDDITRAVANELGWAEFRSRPLAAMLAAGPIFLRGSMNNWSTTTSFKPVGTGEWSVTLALQRGDYTFKVASEDWKSVVFGTERERPIVDATDVMRLYYGANDIALKVTSPGEYRFTFRAADTGNASLSIGPK